MWWIIYLDSIYRRDFCFCDVGGGESIMKIRMKVEKVMYNVIVWVGCFYRIFFYFGYKNVSLGN